MSTNIVKMNRGDSFSFKVRITDAKEPNKRYVLTLDDTLYFALLYPHQKIEDAILLRGWVAGDPDFNNDTGELTVRLFPHDTANLEPGIYYYTVKLQTGGTVGNLYGEEESTKTVRTIVERTKFIINE